jgi:hypothetical protein
VTLPRVLSYRVRFSVSSWLIGYPLPATLISTAKALGGQARVTGLGDHRRMALLEVMAIAEMAMPGRRVLPAATSAGDDVALHGSVMGGALLGIRMLLQLLWRPWRPSLRRRRSPFLPRTGGLRRRALVRRCGRAPAQP